MKILGVTTNNRKRVLEVDTESGVYPFPYAKLDLKPTPDNQILEVYPDPEIGWEAFTVVLESGHEDSVHLDAVLEYNRDPRIMGEILLHNLTLEALKALEQSRLSKRELVRRLKTSPSQLYRLLDPTYYGKSVGQMVALLHLLGRKVELNVSVA